MSRRLLVFPTVLCLAACAGKLPTPSPPLFPLTPTWKTLLSDFVVAPLVTDGRLVFVATRDTAVRALDAATGAVTWQGRDLRGPLSAAEGALLVRGDDGTVWSLHPGTGDVRWKVETGVTGSLPASIDRDRALVAGRGLAAVELSSGRVLWKDTTGADTTTPPVSGGPRVFAGEADGTLRCRDRATGLTLWTLPTGGPLVAPPLVDPDRRRLYLGTTDRRILEVSTDKGKSGWAWRVGADVGHPGLLLGRHVAFTSFDAVLYVLGRGGSLAWRGALPSRPLSAPLSIGGHLLVACLENELVAFTRDTGKKAGQIKTTAEIRSEPILAGGLVVLALRDRSVIAYAPAGSSPPPAEALTPSVAPAP